MRSLLRHPDYYLKKLPFFSPSIRMSGKSFGDQKNQKR